MGSWRLEVGKMFFYVMFPVFAFHLFNQPEVFNKWVVKERDRMETLSPRTTREQFKKIKESFFENLEKDKQKFVQH